MAVLTSSNFYTNAVVGTLQAGANIDLYKTSSTAEFAVGSGFIRGDGAKFRYVQYGAATTAGHLVAPDISEMSIIGSIATNSALAAGTSTAVADDPVTPGQAGSHYLEVSLTPTNVGLFAGGYMVVASGTGSGTCLRIKYNTASGTPSTGRSRLEFYDPLPQSLDTTSDLTILGSIFANVEPANSDTDNAVVGVSVRGGAANTYGWVQTGGVAAALADAATMVIGDTVMLSSGTAGAVTKIKQVGGSTYNTGTGAISAYTVAKHPIVGYCVDPMTSTQFSMIYLTLE